MHPPKWVCRELANIHPYLRLAWMGEVPKDEGELNAGHFVVVQLYHLRDCGDFDDPACMQEFWAVETVLDELGTPYNRRVERGPIFNKDGGTVRDWDPLFRKPVMTIGVKPQDVFSGRVLMTAKRHCLPSNVRKSKRRKALREQGRAVDRRMDDLTREMTSVLMHEAAKPDATGLYHIPQKDARQDMGRNFHRLKNGELEFADYYMRNAPK